MHLRAADQLVSWAWYTELFWKSESKDLSNDPNAACWLGMFSYVFTSLVHVEQRGPRTYTTCLRIF